MHSKKDEIFIYRIGQLGDTLVSLPAIHKIAQNHPNAKFTLITNAPACKTYLTAWDVLKHTGIFSDVIFYDVHRISSILKIIWKTRLTRGKWLYYLVSNRNKLGVKRDRLFFRWICGFRRIIGINKITHGLERDSSGKLLYCSKESERLLNKVSSGSQNLFFSESELNFFIIPAETKEKISLLLKPVMSKRWVALGIGSKMPAKKWFLKRYIKIANKILSHDSNTALVLLGGREDFVDCENILRECARSNRILNLAGKTNIIESAEILLRCFLYIGNDTGTMHLAATMKCPCVAIFSTRENPGLWEPYGNNNIIYRKEVSCEGCMLVECIDMKMKCLDMISVDEVWNGVKQILDTQMTKEL